MPITIKQNLMKYKSDRLHKYVGINSVAERATAEQIEDIEAAGADTIAEVNAAIEAGQTAIDGIETQKNQMIASIAQVAGQGTDATFTQQGVAADAKAVGSLNSALSSVTDAVYERGVSFVKETVSSGSVTYDYKINSGNTYVVTAISAGRTRLRIKKGDGTTTDPVVDLRTGDKTEFTAAVSGYLNSYVDNTGAGFSIIDKTTVEYIVSINTADIETNRINIAKNKSEIDLFNGGSYYSNLFNKLDVYQKYDVNSTTGELVKLADTSTLFTSELIEIDASKRLQTYNLTSTVYYAYDSSKAYLGYGTSFSNPIANTYATAAYIRVQGQIANLDTAYLMYYENRSATYVPYNPIDGNLQNSEYVKRSIFSRAVRWGYLYNKAYIDIDTTASPVTYTLKRGAYVLGSDGFGKNTGISTNTPHTLTGFHSDYCTIVYSISNNDFRCLQDYKGDYSDYVIFGFYDHKYVYGNLGMILVDGGVGNPEILKALSDIDIGEISELREQVQENTTAIGTNASSISAEASARASADTALGARIDNLVAPSGESVAEITDARVGYNGTTYASLEARLNAEAGRVRNVLVVGTDGQYQTIASAISAAQNGDIVFIKRGTYEEHVSNLDKVVHIIGESKDEVIWKHENTDYGSDDCYECGMGSIRNLTMWNYDNGETPSGQYGRSYCIHLDHQNHWSSHPPISNYFYCENVHFINDSNECLGLGLRNNMTMEFVNCTVETLGGNEAAFYVHAASATGAKCILNGCTIVNNSSTGQLGALRVEGYNHTDKGCTADFERNIVVNRGTGPAVVWQLNKVTQQGWRNVPDWDLDVISLLNNDDAINYSPAQ